MNHSKLVFLFLTISTFPLFAQQKVTYVRRTINFSDSVNSRLLSSGAEKLTTVLIHGYINGKLPGYKFDVGTEVLKREPVSLDGYKTWVPDETQNEPVVFDGEVYEPINAPPFFKPSATSEYWTRKMGNPISQRFFFPTKADTLTKSEFLKEMISFSREMPEWSGRTEYIHGDVVNYKGIIYEAKQDNKGEEPSGNPMFWSEQGEALLFFQPDSFDALQILYSTVVNKFEPQIVTPCVRNENGGELKSIGLHFLFDEAINYLNSIQSPLLYDSPLGYVGANELILDDRNRDSLLTIIRSKLLQKIIKPKKNAIIDSKKMQYFSGIMPDQTRYYSCMQLPNNSDIIVYEIDNTQPSRPLFMPFLKLPMSEVFKDIPASVPINFSDFLLGSQFSYSTDTMYYDSLRPRSNSIQKLKPKGRSCFYEKYTSILDSTDSFSQNQMRDLWNLVREYHNKKKIQVSMNSRSDSWRPSWNWESSWKGAKFGYGDKTFQASEHFQPYHYWKFESFRGSLPEFRKVLSFDLVYKRMATRGNSKGEFSPVSISIFNPGDEEYPVVFYSFDWQQLRGLILESDISSLRAFLTSIEKANFTYQHSELDYGLMEN